MDFRTSLRAADAATAEVFSARRKSRRTSSGASSDVCAVDIEIAQDDEGANETTAVILKTISILTESPLNADDITTPVDAVQFVSDAVLKMKRETIERTRAERTRHALPPNDVAEILGLIHKLGSKIA